MDDDEHSDSDVIRSQIHSQTLLGFENVDAKLFSDTSSIDKPNNVSVPPSSVTMMGFAANDHVFEEHKSHPPKPQYEPNQDIQLLGTILHYDRLSRTYSIQLRPNHMSKNASQSHTIQIPSQYIHTTNSESDPDFSCMKHTANQTEIALHHESNHYIRKDLKCILSLYASDATHLEYDKELDTIQRFYHNVYESSKPIGDICDGLFRTSPAAFEEHKVLSSIMNDEITSVKQLLQHDEGNNIYYYHLGCKETNPANQLFFTPKLKWPSIKYSVALWVNWDNDYYRGVLDDEQHLDTVLTTFDSANFAPIYVDNRGHLGCHSAGKGEKVTTYTVQNGWNFVIALGSRDKTMFYVGNLIEIPQVIGWVRCSVCGQETERIGERDQGPGKLAFVAVLDGHLDVDEMKELYYESRSEIQGTWNQQQVEEIKQLILTLFDGIVAIARITIQYAKCTKF